VSVLPILLWPDPALARKAAPVGELDDGIRRLARDMLETMYAAPGRGLAAPQVGVLKRIFVMDVTWKEGERAPVVCVDPEIVSVSEERIAIDEGCLSIPGITTRITRPESIRLAWTTLDGDRVVADLGGLPARVAQHEFDHLEGTVTFDRLDPEERAAALAGYGAADA
jgi:peptide deformylase